LADAERDAAGQLRAVRFSWLERGNRQHESWENTVLGTIAIDGPRLTIEVNSARRSRRIRTQVEERLGEDAVFRAALTESIRSSSRGRRRRRRSGAVRGRARRASGSRRSSPSSPATRATPRSRNSPPTWRNCARGWGCDRRLGGHPKPANDRQLKTGQ